MATGKILQRYSNPAVHNWLKWARKFLYSDSLHLYAFASRRTHPDGLHPPGLYFRTRECQQQQASIPCVGLTAESPASGEQKLGLVAIVSLGEEGWTPFEENQLMTLVNGHILE